MKESVAYFVVMLPGVVALEGVAADHHHATLGAVVAAVCLTTAAWVGRFS